MGTTAALEVRIGFDGNAETVTTWTDVSDLIQQTSFSYGRKKPGEMWPANRAWFTMLDTDRTFDPTNTGSPHAGDLVAGRQVEIVVRESGNVVRRWRGYTEQFVPGWMNASAAGEVLVQCVDRLGKAQRVDIPLRPADLARLKITESAGGGAYYTFKPDFIDGSSFVEDLGSGGFTARVYQNAATTPTPNHTQIGNAIRLNGNDYVDMPLPPQTIARYPGVFAAIDFQARPPSGNTPIRRWPLISDGYGQIGGWNVYLSCTRAGATFVDSDPMTLTWEMRVPASAIAAVFGFQVGTYGDWVGHRRCVAVGTTASRVTIGWSVAQGSTEQINGASFNASANNYTRPAVTASGGTSDFDAKHIGTRYGGQDLAVMDVYAATLVQAPASEDFIDAFVESYWEAGMVADDITAERADILNTIGLPANWVTEEITNEPDVSPAATLGLSSVLTYLQTLALMMRGAVFQDRLGDVRLVDNANRFDQIANAYTYGRFNSQRAFSDRELRVYSDDTLALNDVTVTIPTGGVLKARRNDLIDRFGRYARSFNLPFGSSSAAQAFANDIVSNPEPYVHFTVHPDADPDGWTDIATQDIGTRFRWQYRPYGQSGTVSLVQIVEGEQWSYSTQSDLWAVKVYGGPHP